MYHLCANLHVLHSLAKVKILLTLFVCVFEMICSWFCKVKIFGERLFVLQYLRNVSECSCCASFLYSLIVVLYITKVGGTPTCLLLTLNYPLHRRYTENKAIKIATVKRCLKYNNFHAINWKHLHISRIMNFFAAKKKKKKKFAALKMWMIHTNRIPICSTSRPHNRLEQKTIKCINYLI